MVVCPVCNAVTPDDATACGSCGNRLISQKPSPFAHGAPTRPLPGLFTGTTHGGASASLAAPYDSAATPSHAVPDRSPRSGVHVSPLLHEDQLLAGRYRVGAHIGYGAMGKVWRGTDERLEGRPCAIKTIDLSRLGAEEAVEARAMFEREISVLARLSHPGMCEIRDVVTEGETRYLVMEFVDGITLAERLKLNGGRALPEATVLGWAAMLVDALSYLHAQVPQIIFRDVKPQNVILRPDGRVTLVDFGIARTMIMAGGTAIGTGGYAPPEQYQGLADVRSDEYALAATIHHLLTGRDPTLFSPFVFPHARGIVPSLSEYVDVALERALSMSSASRFPTVAEFGLALQGRLAFPSLVDQFSVSPSGVYSRYPSPSSAGPSSLVPVARASGSLAGRLTSRTALDDAANSGLAVRCASCGEANTSVAAYCNFCGLRLGVVPAGFWIRVGAYVGDSVVLFIAGKIASPLLTGITGPGSSYSYTANGSEYMTHTTNSGASVLSFGFSFVLALLYFGIFWTRAGWTPGMRMFGLKVRDCSGDLMTWSQAIGRYLMLFVSFMCIFLGVLSVAWQRDKRGWHDLASGTEVIRSRD